MLEDNFQVLQQLLLPTGILIEQTNPSAVAAQLGGYLMQLNSYDKAFRNMDMYMLMTKEHRLALKLKTV